MPVQAPHHNQYQGMPLADYEALHWKRTLVIGVLTIGSLILLPFMIALIMWVWPYRIAVAIGVIAILIGLGVVEYIHLHKKRNIDLDARRNKSKAIHESE